MFKNRTIAILLTLAVFSANCTTPAITPSSAPTSTPVSSPISAATSTPTSTPVSTPTSVTTSAPTSTPVSSPISAATSTPTSTPVPTPTSTQSPVAVNDSLIFVPGGTFLMGDDFLPSATPEHNVTLSSFYIWKYEVTQYEYETILGAKPSNFKGTSLPVEHVSWFDALRYCNALSRSEGLPVAYNETSGNLLDASGTVTTDVTKVKGYRLPTESEWEYSARGANKLPEYTYSGSYIPGDTGWIIDNSENRTHQVGTKAPNKLGLYDMSGNVWEWTQDWYEDYNGDSLTNPYISSGGPNRVIRGGSWNSIADYGRVYHRGNIFTPDYSGYDVGFRVARSAP